MVMLQVKILGECCSITGSGVRTHNEIAFAVFPSGKKDGSELIQILRIHERGRSVTAGGSYGRYSWLLAYTREGC
jgi:hypothetical protein